MAQRCRSALIEEDAHLRRGQSAARCVLQHSACLIKSNAREQLNELTDRHSVFEILEQSCNGHA